MRCARCDELLDEWARSDRRTCTVRCRVALWRASQALARPMTDAVDGTGVKPPTARHGPK